MTHLQLSNHHDHWNQYFRYMVYELLYSNLHEFHLIKRRVTRSNRAGSSLKTI